VKAHLEITQREAFDLAVTWVDSNPTIPIALRSRPEVIEAGLFRCDPPKGFFGRMMARRAALLEEQALLVDAPGGAGRRRQAS
jgi:hypothetical protein